MYVPTTSHRTRTALDAAERARAAAIGTFWTRLNPFS